jgi:hypothetical protein
MIPGSIKGYLIIAVMFWLALSYQNNHRDFASSKVVSIR